MANRFENILSENGDALMRRRAENIALTAKNEQKTLILNLTSQINNIELEIKSLEDLSVKNRDDLNPGASFNAKNWVQDLHTRYIDLRNLKIELEIAENTYNYYFSDDSEFKQDKK